MVELKASKSDACSEPEPELKKGNGKGKQIIDADPSTIVATAKIQKNNPKIQRRGTYFPLTDVGEGFTTAIHCR